MSDERARAEHYEAHKDDETEWEEPEAAPKERRRLASMISVRLSPKEAQVVREAAEQQRVSVSAFLRRAALLAAMRPLTPEPEAAPQVSAPRSGSLSMPHLTVLQAPQEVDVAHVGNTDVNRAWC